MANSQTQAVALTLGKLCAAATCAATLVACKPKDPEPDVAAGGLPQLLLPGPYLLGESLVDDLERML